MYCVDLETSFAGKGSKRKDAWILQIGAASSKKVFDMLVRPEFRLAVHTPSDLYRELRLAKQQPRMTINFWTRVLERTNNVKRTGTREEFIIRHIPKMVPLRTALLRLIAFTGVSATVWAHNGKSFDFPILRGNAEKVDVSLEGWSMKDSLPLVRKAWPSDASHSLPNVYKNHVSKKPYRAHLAGDDAIALYRVLEKALPVYQSNMGKKLIHKGLGPRLKPGMVPGLGKVACQRLQRKNIHTLKDLKACLKKDDAWWKSTIPLWRKVRSYISYK
jgi:hypothetical protein